MVRAALLRCSFFFLPWTAAQTCYMNDRSHSLNRQDCRKALDKIVYDSTGCLGGASTSLLAWHQSCAVKLIKPKKSTPARAEVERGFHEVLQTCNATGGLSSHLNVTVLVYRATPRTVPAWTQRECQIKTCTFHKSDCLVAFNRLPVDQIGNFLPTIQNFAARRTHGNCSLTISTTDHSSFNTSRAAVSSALNSLLHRCGHHPGKIYLYGGTSSYNGSIKISISSNGTCS